METQLTREKTGIKNFTVFPRKIGEDGNIGFGEPQKVQYMKTVGTTLTYAEASDYADNIQIIKDKKLKSADIDTEFADITLKTKAIMQGQKYNSGGAELTTDDQAIPVAVAWSETYSDGTEERKVFYNIKLYEKDTSNQTETDSVNFTTQGFAGTALPFTNDKVTNAIMFRMDSGDESYDPVKWNNFFKEVQYFEKDVTADYTATGDVTDISVKGITYDKDAKKFIGIYANCLSFTFKDGTDEKTATRAKKDDTFTIS